MSIQYLVNTGQRTNLAANTAATMIEIATGASMAPEWIELDIANMAASGFTVVSFATSTASGTGTTQTPKRVGTAVGSALSTAKVNLTVEGTGVADFWTLVYANPFTDRIQWPLGREQFQPVSTFQGVRFLSSVAGSATAPATAALVIEE